MFRSWKDYFYFIALMILMWVLIGFAICGLAMLFACPPEEEEIAAFTIEVPIEHKHRGEEVKVYFF